MIARFINWFFGDVASVMVSVKPVYLDAFLYTVAAMFIFWQGFLGGEEAYKYVNPYVLFWFKGIVGGLTAGVIALKMFRSDSYAKHVEKESQQNKQQGT